ncbi:MAG: phosphomannomutase/phosphoglucomutase [Syntrophales bacterium]|nr:phosphomannomutase/phosphoglucomutase [Syntrophales bacterium]MCK9392548.1 phosphomannomutase/phosphoglucomutase [Syntrophales bacterium]
MNTEVFREYDVRGLVDKDLTSDFVYHLGRAIGTYARRHGVKTMTVGRDCRLSSESYAETIGRGISDTGISIIDIGLCATPMLYFSIRHFQVDGGIMVTGSHNPPDFNGFKICIGPDTIYGDDIQELRRIMEKGSYDPVRAGDVSAGDITLTYQDYLVRNVVVREGLNIVVDAGNGTGGLFALPIFRRLGCRITELYCEPDGHFPNHHPDPTVPENLKELISLVKEKKADAGIAFDGDADRLGIITDQGNILWGDEILLLFSRSILKKNPGAAIIGEVKCSQTLYDDIAKNGGRAIMWKAGHSLIKGKMKEEHALLAGEMSGHLFFADRYFGYDDAIYAAIRLLEILSDSAGKKISDIMADVPRTFTTPEIRIDCPDDIKFRVVEAVKDHFSREYPIIDIDGVRITFADGWGLLRSSNTQPVLVLRFEAISDKRLQEIRDLIEGVLNKVLQRLLPIKK